MINALLYEPFVSYGAFVKKRKGSSVSGRGLKRDTEMGAIPIRTWDIDQDLLTIIYFFTSKDPHLAMEIKKITQWRRLYGEI